MVGLEKLVAVIARVILDLLEDLTMTVLLLSLCFGAFGLDAIEVFGRTGLLLLDCFKRSVLAVLESSRCLSCS